MSNYDNLELTIKTHFFISLIKLDCSFTDQIKFGYKHKLKEPVSLLILDQQPTVCQYQHRQQTNNAALGTLIPRCKPDGSYDDVQCRESVCYCVDRRGNELPGTGVSIGEGSPNCATPGMINFS